MSTALFLWQNKSPTNIGGVEVDVLVEQEYTKVADAPEHPVENGFKVSDHVIHKPAEISMLIAIGVSPVTWNRLGNGFNRPQDILSKIETLMDKAEPIKVITNFRVYDNVVITKMSAPQRIEDGQGIKIALDLKRIVLANSKTVSIPSAYVKLLDSKGRSGKTANAKGSASTKTPNSKTQNKVNSSLLKSASSKISSFMKG